MRWIKWTMLAAAGCMPALAQAEEPTTRPAAQGTAWFRARLGNDEQLGTSILVQSGDAKEEPKVEDKVVPLPRRILVEVGDPDHDGPHPAPPGPLGLRNLQRVPGAMTFALDILTHEKGSYLGISASPPPAVIRKQLGLKPGMGLVIEFVVPDSPAAKAGVEKYDVLEKLDDQLIINQEQLSVLVRDHKVGDEVELGVIHDGKQTTLTAKLAEHDLEPLADEGQGAERFDLVLPWVPAPQIHPLPPPGTPEALERLLRSQLNSIQAGPKSVTWMEGDHSYTVTTNNEGHKIFTAKDKDGKPTFEGPIDTKEQRDKLSPELKEKLERMQQHMPGDSIRKWAPAGQNPQPAPEVKKPKDKDSDEK